MTRSRGQRARDKNKENLPQVPDQLKADGMDVEYAEELADAEDREANLRAEAANRRAKNRKD